MSAKTEPADSHVAVLHAILGCYLTCRSKLDLLVFWGRFPCGWFDRRAIRPLTRSSREEIERALDELVDEGVIRCRGDGTVASYALTEVGGIRRAVEDLPRLTRFERRHLLRRSMRQYETGDDQQDDQPTPRVLRETPDGVEA